MTAVLNGEDLPFADGTLLAIVRTNVFRHLARPRRFFKEAARCVRASGRIVAIEPWVTPWSMLVYGGCTMSRLIRKPRNRDLRKAGPYPERTGRFHGSSCIVTGLDSRSSFPIGRSILYYEADDAFSVPDLRRSIPAKSDARVDDWPVAHAGKCAHALDGRLGDVCASGSAAQISRLRLSPQGTRLLPSAYCTGAPCVMNGPDSSPALKNDFSRGQQVKLNIWLLQTGEPLPLNNSVRKMRTCHLADKLTARGHSVLWWASAFDHMHKKMLFPQDTDIQLGPAFSIRALRGLGYQRTVSPMRFLDHWILAKKYRRQAIRMPKPDVLVVSMPDYQLAYESVRIARMTNVPVIVDIRDPWPESFLDFVPKALEPLARMAIGPELRKLRLSLKGADSLVSMMSNLLNWGLGYAERKATLKDKVFFLGAQRPAGQPKSLRSDLSRLLDRMARKFSVTYIGTFGRLNNPMILIKAARFLREIVSDSNDYLFVIAGDGTMREAVAQEAKGLDNVELPGWLNDVESAAVMAASSVGVIPWAGTRRGGRHNAIDFAFPNKSFTYLSAGVPIIASVEGDLKTLLSKNKIGFYFEPMDHRTLAELIRSVKEHPEHLKEMSANARFVFNRELDADKIYEAFADHVEQVAEEWQQRKGNPS